MPRRSCRWSCRARAGRASRRRRTAGTGGSRSCQPLGRKRAAKRLGSVRIAPKASRDPATANRGVDRTRRRAPRTCLTSTPMRATVSPAVPSPLERAPARSASAGVPLEIAAMAVAGGGGGRVGALAAAGARPRGAPLPHGAVRSGRLERLEQPLVRRPPHARLQHPVPACCRAAGGRAHGRPGSDVGRRVLRGAGAPPRRAGCAPGRERCGSPPARAPTCSPAASCSRWASPSGSAHAWRPSAAGRC